MRSPRPTGKPFRRKRKRRSTRSIATSSSVTATCRHSRSIPRRTEGARTSRKPRTSTHAPMGSMTSWSSPTQTGRSSAPTPWIRRDGRWTPPGSWAAPYARKTGSRRRSASPRVRRTTRTCVPTRSWRRSGETKGARSCSPRPSSMRAARRCGCGPTSPRGIASSERSRSRSARVSWRAASPTQRRRSSRRRGSSSTTPTRRRSAS